MADIFVSGTNHEPQGQEKKKELGETENITKRKMRKEKGKVRTDDEREQRENRHRPRQTEKEQKQGLRKEWEMRKT